MSYPEPPVEDLESWVTWRARVHDMPDWWQELAEVPGVDNHEKLAQEVWASFELPWQISQQHCIENYHQAPPALLCICQKSFLLPPDSLSSPAETSGNCSRRRQWPMPKPSSFGRKKPICLLRANHAFLAGSIVELREKMKCYVSFSDQDVFSGMALLEEPLITQSKEAAP